MKRGNMIAAIIAAANTVSAMISGIIGTAPPAADSGRSIAGPQTRIPGESRGPPADSRDAATVGPGLRRACGNEGGGRLGKSSHRAPGLAELHCAAGW